MRMAGPFFQKDPAISFSCTAQKAFSILIPRHEIACLSAMRCCVAIKFASILPVCIVGGSATQCLSPLGGSNSF